MEFENDADWQYYLKEDPAHIEFKKSLRDVVEKVGVVDYMPGVF